MKTYSNYIFEQQLDEFINNDIIEINEGIFDWFKKMGKKFMNWLSGKEYDNDTDWSFGKKNKAIQMNGGEWDAMFDKNKELGKKFPISYKLSKSEFSKCNCSIVFNADKAFPMIMIWDNDSNNMLNALKRTRLKENAQEIVDEIGNDKKNILVFNIEFADQKNTDKNNLSHAGGLIYKTFNESEGLWFFINEKTPLYYLYKLIDANTDDETILAKPQKIDIEKLNKATQ